ncbi:hypothetical protein OSCI_3800031 [Kamptonema sp. PCC 6506]|nr:hypothetical protein OSCI_3800031 [Kamptonema sp. PCC 6506]
MRYQAALHPELSYVKILARAIATGQPITPKILGLTAPTTRPVNSDAKPHPLYYNNF